MFGRLLLLIGVVVRLAVPTNAFGAESNAPNTITQEVIVKNYRHDSTLPPVLAGEQTFTEVEENEECEQNVPLLDGWADVDSFWVRHTFGSPTGVLCALESTYAQASASALPRAALYILHQQYRL
jgi:hypothetical protein